jgi:hypothetical protein
VCVIDVLLCSAHAMDASDPLSVERREFFTHTRTQSSVSCTRTDGFECRSRGVTDDRTTRVCVCVYPPPNCSYRRMLFTHDDVYTRQTQKEEREREIDGGGYEREADRMIGLISKTTPSHNRKRFYFYFRLPIISPFFCCCLSDI